jgi:predicted regulator of Ras-like GTPase activity (Roadblock/LC7/MglB family)
MPALPQLIEEDIRQLDGALKDLLRKSEAILTFIIDKGGFLITRCGDSKDLNATTLAALAAASFAATQGIADLVSEPNFHCVYQQGENFSLLVQNVDENCLLVIIFGSDTTVGAVKFYAANTIAQVAAQLQVAHQRDPSALLDLSVLNLADPSEVFFKKKS